MNETEQVESINGGGDLGESFWTEVDAVPWADIPSPGDPLDGPYFGVRTALTTLANAKGREEAITAYNVTLDAIGHNHSGTVYAAFIPALPFLIRISLVGRPWAQYAALEVMIDALAWLPEGPRREPLYPMRDDAREAFTSFAPSLRQLVTAPGLDGRIRASAEELLETISDVYGIDGTN